MGTQKNRLSEKMEFLHSSTTPLSLFMNKNDATLLIKSNLNLHVLIFFNKKMILKIVCLFFFHQKYFYLIFALEMFFVFPQLLRHRKPDNIEFECWFGEILKKLKR